MILSGLSHTHILPSGQMLTRVVAIAIIISLLLGGCSAEWLIGDGRGDWTLDLCSGYAISKINSREILFIHKDNSNAAGGTIIIPNYFVTAYQIQNPYIFLEGIQTEKITVSDDELYNREVTYYIIDSTEDNIIGPFESYDDFIKNPIAFEIKDEWNSIA